MDVDDVTVGNRRLTALTGCVLLVLLALEGATLISLRSFLTWHIALGRAMSLHVLGHVLHLPALAGADLRGGGAGGARLRLALLAGTMVVGALIAVISWHLATPWLHVFDD